MKYLIREIDDISNIKELEDFCKSNSCEVDIISEYMEPSIYRVSYRGNEITRVVCDCGCSSEKKLGFIKNMMRAVMTDVNDMTEYPKIIFARGNQKTVFLKEYLNAIFGAGNFAIKKVIFNNPATIVMWADGTKTVVKATDEEFDPEKGLAMAISKKALGNSRDYYHTFLHWLKKYEKQEKQEIGLNSISVEEAAENLRRITDSLGF